MGGLGEAALGVPVLDRALDAGGITAEEAEAIQTVKADTSGTSSGTTNLGALLRAKMDNKTTE